MRTNFSIFTAFFLLAFYTVNGQLCQGSLGDPIVNISFGSGFNPGNPLSAATTNYTYYSGDCPNDGYYTVRNNTSACFSSSWHTLNTDHTGNPNGYFMLVNASLQPSAFYIDTVKGLCSNTTFEFAAWVVNVLKASACDGNGNQPNLTFTIEKRDGTVLKTYNTGNIPQLSFPQWKQYGFYFNTPADVADIVLRIFNNAPGGCGNDLALDDITFRPCGPQLQTSIDGYSTSTVSFCKGELKTFTMRSNISAGFNNPSYQWQMSRDGITWTDIPGAGTQALTVSFGADAADGQYQYRVTAAEQGNLNSVKCRVASTVLQVEVNPLPVTNISLRSPACTGDNLTITGAGAAVYQWTGPGINSVSNPVSINNVQASNAGRIYLFATSDKGCTHTDSATLVVLTTPVANVSFPEANICSGGSVQLSATGGDTYQWQPATGLSASNLSNPVASPEDSTVYTVLVTNGNFCSDSAQVRINVIQRPVANAGPDKTILTGSGVQLEGTATGQDISYHWSPADHLSDAGLLQPLADPVVETEYTLTVSSNAGCGTDADKMKLFVFKDIYIPNAFSPNGNSINDTWNIPALNAFPGFELAVYNRRGQLVYQCRNLFTPWNGTYKGEPQPAGNYVYVIDLRRPGIPVLKGNLLLVR